MLGLEPHEAHVWESALDGVDADAALLSPDERARSERFVYPLHRQRFIARRCILRRLISGYVGIAPERIVFAYGPNGKPMLPDGGLELNISDSADRALFAFARRPLGIDLEKLRVVDDALAISRRFFSPPETAALASLPPEPRSARFLDIWTLKEAFVKGVGQGLSRPLTSFTVPLDRDDRRLQFPLDGLAESPDWRLHRLAVAHGFVGALAAPGDDLRIHYRIWPDGLVG